MLHRRRNIIRCSWLLCNQDDRNILRRVNNEDDNFTIINVMGNNNFANSIARCVEINGPIVGSVRIPFYGSRKYLRRIRPFGRDLVIRNHKNMRRVNNNKYNWIFNRIRNRSKAVAHIERSKQLVRRAINRYNN